MKGATTDKMHTSVTAEAHANIALIKYWGKRSTDLNLPAVGSISLTLDDLKTETTVSFSDDLDSDRFELNGQQVDGDGLERISSFLDYLHEGPERPGAIVKSNNNFPTGAGLASSASGFAALAVSAASAAGKELSKKELSALARYGSGSAARSIYGGFAEMECQDTGSANSGAAKSLYDHNYWDIRLLIAVTSSQKKDVSSTEGMNRTANTAPYFKSWVQEQAQDLSDMRSAIAEKDFEKVGELTEHSCFKMHGLAMAARPPLLYWNDTTIKTIHAVWDLRKQGIPVYLTIDAGPQVKMLCKPADVKVVRQALETINGIEQLRCCKPGPPAKIKSTN